MTWFRVDDSFADHPKVKAIPQARRLRAVGLWLACGTWSARHLTDGFVPSLLPRDQGARAGDVQSLVDARVHPDGVGLWEPVDGGWVFHDWCDYQPTRKAVQDRRNQAAERVKRWREKNANPPPDEDL